MRTLELQVVCLPETARNIQYAVVTHGKLPATPEQLYRLVMQRLEGGVCVFVYIISDGSYRTAIGTLNSKLIPGNPPARVAKADEPTQTYWDFERAAFRDFRRNNVVAIINL